MEHKFTPGPWVIAGDEIETAEGQYVCHFGDGLEADARLIAAAPELLEALRAFNVTERMIVGGTADSLTIRVPISVLQNAAAAIAKATGEATPSGNGGEG